MLALTMLVGSTLFAESNSAEIGPQAFSENGLSRQGRLHVLELSGSPRERGLRHGRALQSEIAAVLELWRQDIAANTGRPAAEVIAEFLAASRFMPTIEKWTPGLIDEVRGIAEGANQPFETLFAFQLLDELWVYLDQAEAHHCSSLGVPARDGQPGFVAQNMDLESYRDGYQVVLHIAESADEPEQFIFTCAGLIATNGMNRHGIAIACNTLMELNASPSGLPVAFVHRGLLRRREAAAAREFLVTLPHASGQNYILGTPQGVTDYEASAGKVVAVPTAPNGAVIHTNHTLVNDDLKPWHRAMMEALSAEQRANDNSTIRLAALDRRIARVEGNITADVIKQTLRSKDSTTHPICRPLSPGRGYTFGAVVMTLSVPASLEVSAGPPDKNPFVRFTFAASDL